MKLPLATIALTCFSVCQSVPVSRAAETESFTVDPAESEIRILVYKDGPLARLGHNHVITSNSISGRVLVQPRFENSSFELEIPVAELSVDAPEARAASGPEFSTSPSADDIAGTRANMLGARLLDANRFPAIRVAGQLTDVTATPAVDLELVVRDYVAERRVPIELRREPDSITVSGELEIYHEELGLRPFRVMMGALRVAEGIRLQFRITATRSPATP